MQKSYEDRAELPYTPRPASLPLTVDVAAARGQGGVAGCAHGARRSRRCSARPFPARVHLLFSNSSQDTPLHLAASALPPLVCDTFCLPSYDLDVVEMCGSGVVWTAHLLGFVWCFLLIRPGLQILVR